MEKPISKLKMRCTMEDGLALVDPVPLGLGMPE